VAGVGAAVHHNAAKTGAVRELAALLVDLNGQLSRRRDDQRRGCGRAHRTSCCTVRQHEVHSRDEVRCRFSGACLSACHHVTAGNHNRNTIPLDWRRLCVAATRDVLHELLV